MAEIDGDLNETNGLRELDPDIKQQDIAVAMMYVFPKFSNGLIQPKSFHKMVEYKSERCLAIAVKMDNPMSDFQLDHLRGNYPDISPGYPNYFFHQEDGLLYVGIPMSTVLGANERLVAQAMAEFGNYETDFQDLEGERTTDAIVQALVRDFDSKFLTLDLSSLVAGEDS